MEKLEMIVTVLGFATCIFVLVMGIALVIIAAYIRTQDKKTEECISLK